MRLHVKKLSTLTLILILTLTLARSPQPTLCVLSFQPQLTFVLICVCARCDVEGGGGFIGNPATPAMTSNSQNDGMSPARNKGGRDRQNLVPVTIAQVLSAEQATPEDPFFINGMDVVNVRRMCVCFCAPVLSSLGSENYALKRARTFISFPGQTDRTHQLPSGSFDQYHFHTA